MRMTDKQFKEEILCRAEQKKAAARKKRRIVFSLFPLALCVLLAFPALSIFLPHKEFASSDEHTGAGAAFDTVTDVVSSESKTLNAASVIVQHGEQENVITDTARKENIVFTLKAAVQNDQKTEDSARDDLALPQGASGANLKGNNQTQTNGDEEVKDSVAVKIIITGYDGSTQTYVIAGQNVLDGQGTLLATLSKQQLTKINKILFSE